MVYSSVRQRLSRIGGLEWVFAFGMRGDMLVGMRPTYVAAAVGMAIAALFTAPGVLMGASAHADISGYRRCVGSVKEVPISNPDPTNMQLVGTVEMDLKSGVSPAAESQKLARSGLDPRLADAVVQCVMRENP